MWGEVYGLKVGHGRVLRQPVYKEAGYVHMVHAYIWFLESVGFMFRDKMRRDFDDDTDDTSSRSKTSPESIQ